MFQWVQVAQPALRLVGVIPRSLSLSAPSSAKRWTKKTRIPFEDQFHNPVNEVYGHRIPPDKGHVYDNKPFKVAVQKHRVYTWCGCGLSHSQPFCDDSHRNRYIQGMVQGGPVKYVATEDKDVWFCNCKQTAHRPFCDGSHRAQEIQEAHLEGKVLIFNPKRS
ncbi:hypothetical protein TCAL_00859 [Tigriopus californicus]|uniref:Iron-binding zinc finger CDGSH type domain-containing protein n=1 Tax=Tigriopus californicus TaxID=6832 RepID=A0A553ND36_TIGCA|nr:CDGSH iron-sulfur domain-containing protein 3, mitochondrial-like [Tigriopus californicus]TRY63361.1 hypothetical protein TCAL_00859 [Tigriopus californicus]|eukprot:TCALIF_00859-PA protein Name:"Similar to CISD3 CDGSH iron-sulfur domain-containing protein 3, mitochondrial (Homo sapiens)" AED:0.10 eAED:0.10 QI:0/-1/0/1/-1/1/1/0/162